MAIEIGKKFSDQMSRKLRFSLDGKEMAKIAARNDVSAYVVKSLIKAERGVTKNTFELAKDILRHAFHVNKLEIRKREALNTELEPIINELEPSEQAA